MTKKLHEPLDEVDPDDVAAIRGLGLVSIVGAATFVLCELAWHGASKRAARRTTDGRPPMFRRAGKAGYCDGYRDGLAAGGGQATAS